MLRFINTKLRLLGRYCLKLGPETEVIYDDIINTLSKTEFSALTMGMENLIAITGLQGVGKTTLIKEYYGLETDDFAIGIEESERLPVLIRERDVDNIQYLVYYLDSQDAAVKSFMMQQDEARDRMTEKKQSDLYFEVIIPKRVSPDYDPTRTFVLLPGIVNIENLTELDKRILHCLVYSTNCVVCIDEFTIAGSSNEKFVKDYVSTFFQSSKPIFAITRSNQLGDAKALELKAKYSSPEILGLGDEEMDRVIITGLTKDVGQTWVSELSTIVNKYSSNSNEYQMQKHRFLKEALKEITLIDKKINAALHDLDFEHDEKSLRIDKDIQTFIDVKSKILDMLEKSLSSVFNSVAGKCQDEVTKSLVGIKNIPDLWRTKFSRRVLRSEQIINIWHKNLLLSMDELLSAIEQVENDFSFIIGQGSPVSQEITERLGYEANQNLPMHRDEVSDDKQGRIIYTIAKYMGRKPYLTSSIEIHEERETALRMMPIVMTEFVRLHLIGVHDQHLDYSSVNHEDNEYIYNVLKSCAENTTQLASNVKPMLGGLVAMLGIDYLPDQKLNMLQPLLQGIGLTEAAAAQWAGILGGAMLAGVIVIPATVALRAAHTANQEDTAAFAREYLRTIAFNGNQSILSAFDHAFDMVEQRIREQFRQDIGINKDKDNLHNLTLRICELRELKSELLSILE